MDVSQAGALGPMDSASAPQAYAEFWLSFDADVEMASAQTNDDEAGDAYEQFWKMSDAD